MNRKECFSYIKTNNLNEEVKKEFGKNYTLVKTELLNEFINKKESAKKVEPKINKEDAKQFIKNCDVNFNYEEFMKTLKQRKFAYDNKWVATQFKRLVSLLKKKNLITKAEIEKYLYM